MVLLAISLAPILVILFYLYFRDKYEKEPVGLIIRAFVLGAISTIPIVIVEMYLSDLWEQFTGGRADKYATAAYSAFVVASFTEELFKLLVVFLFWSNKNFNEKFDGIVYAVFVSMGFAAVENVMYVYGGGTSTGILRAFTAVPGHAIFGIVMGYYLGIAKFHKEIRSINIVLAFFMPFLLHGIYDFILFAENGWLLLLFIPYLIYMWRVGFRNLKKHSDESPFKDVPVLPNNEIPT